MVVFYILVLTPIIIHHIKFPAYAGIHQKKNSFAMKFFFIFLTVLIMFRHESVGSDTRIYMGLFERYANMELSGWGIGVSEVGYVYLNKLVYFVSEEPQFLLAVTAIIVSALIYPTYKRLCTDASLTIVLFCTMSTFIMMFSGIKQILACGIGMIAYDFTRKKRIVPFLLAVCLAMSFHTSAFMLFFMYPLYHARVTRKWLYVIIPLMAVIFMFNEPIFSFLTMILSQLTEFEGEITSTGAYTMLLLFGLFAVFAFLIPDESSMDTETIGLRNFLLFSLALQMFAPLHTLAMRMNYYYILFVPLLLPKIIQYRSKRWNQVAILGRHVMVAFFLFYFFANAYQGKNLNVFPYHFFWESVG